jgi:phosphomannomutase
VIASALVDAKPDLKDIEELNEIKNQIPSAIPNLKRMELRYSGTEPLFRVMLEGDLSSSESQLAETAWKMCKSVQTASGIKKGDSRSIEILNVSHGGLLTPNEDGKD